MRNIKYTEGPWSYEYDNQNGEPCITGGGGQLVCTVNHECVKPRDELEINAKIISKSLCLLLTLEDLVSHAQETPFPNSGLKWSIDEAKELINEIRGE